MCCLESSLDGFSHGFVVPELVDGVVACDDYFFWPDVDGPSLGLCQEAVAVSPYLEVVSKFLTVEVVQDDVVFALVPIPIPSILVLKNGSNMR